MKTDYFLFTLMNLGYTFYDNITLLSIRKDILHNLYSDSKTDIKQLTAGTHPRYKKRRSEDWALISFNNEEVPTCTRKFVTIRDEVRLIDRNTDELRSEAKRIYEVLKENNLIKN